MQQAWNCSFKILSIPVLVLAITGSEWIILGSEAEEVDSLGHRVDLGLPNRLALASDPHIHARANVRGETSNQSFDDDDDEWRRHKATQRPNLQQGGA